MTLIFSVSPEVETKIPVNEIQVLTRSFCEHQQTGVIRLAYESGAHLYLFIKRGEVLNAHLVAQASQESLSLEHWADWVNSSGEAYVKVAPLSSFGMLVLKMLIQSENGISDTSLQPDQLSEYFASFRKNSELCLLQLNWENAMGAVLFSRKEKITHSLFLSHETILDEPGVNEVFSRWNNSHCTITTFTPVLSADAWQEYYLRISFADICDRTLNRFEMMTGRALVDSLVRLMAVFTARNKLDINILSRKLIDHELFSTPQEAAQNYRQILSEMFGHFSAVVGPRLLAITLREIIESLPDREREIIQTYKLLPEGYFYE